ncbi:MAG: (Fe-S)-binding protein [Chloroflexi bacterium]|nr:(Fe-S)-binding protein [Chloroflexota bacterium]
MPRQILDVRARLVASRGLPPAKRAVLELFQHPRLFDLAARAAVVVLRPLRTSQRTLNVPQPARYGWRRLPQLAEHPARDELFDRTFEPFEPRNGPWVKSGARGKTVAYFIQCVTDRFAPEQALAAVRLLQACGARVTVPRSQHCCGLPHLDSGDLPGARRLAKATITALEAEEADYVVTAAASCAVSILHDYAHLLRDEPSWVSRAERLGNRTMDLLSFLERVATPAPLPESDGPKVTYHSFCQSTNVLGIGEVGPRLLRLAGVRLEELPEATVCCGFGGATSIDYPEVGRGIVSRKLENVRATGAQVLCSDNPGCLLHLRGAAQAAGDNFLQVRHIAELLAERVAPV